MSGIDGQGNNYNFELNSHYRLKFLIWKYGT